MLVILDEISVSGPVVAKIKQALEQRRGQNLTAAEAKAEFRKMALHLLKNDIKAYLRDTHTSQAPQHPDVDTDLDPDA